LRLTNTLIFIIITLPQQAPLHLAVLDCKNEVLRLLLQCGVSLTPVDESGQTPLALARVIGNSTAVTMLEAEHGNATCWILLETISTNGYC